jgi:hypothetical protein
MSLHSSNIQSKKTLKSDIVINVTTMSSLNKSKYMCDYCINNFSSRQSKWRHMKICNKKSLVETKLDNLEKSLNLIIEQNIDSITLIKLMNKQIKSIIIINKIINSMYWNKQIIKIIEELKKTIKLNIKTYLLLTKDYNKFDKNIKNQIKKNLDIMNKLKKSLKYLEFQNPKQYIFRSHIEKLQKIILNNQIPKKLKKEIDEEEIISINNLDLEDLSKINTFSMKTNDWSDFNPSDSDKTDSSNDI